MFRSVVKTYLGKLPMVVGLGPYLPKCFARNSMKCPDMHKKVEEGCWWGKSTKTGLPKIV